MFRKRHEARYAMPVTLVFAALLRVLARRRWARESWYDPARLRPLVGGHYVCRNGAVVRRGRVVECLQPVLLTLYESLFDPPCRVRLRLRWRLEPLETGTSVLLDARYELNRTAHLNRRRWHEQINAHCDRILAAVQLALVEDAVQRTVVSGQKIGSSSMTATNTTAVNGNPTFK